MWSWSVVWRDAEPGLFRILSETLTPASCSFRAQACQAHGRPGPWTRICLAGASVQGQNQDAVTAWGSTPQQLIRCYKAADPLSVTQTLVYRKKKKVLLANLTSVSISGILNLHLWKNHLKLPNVFFDPVGPSSSGLRNVERGKAQSVCCYLGFSDNPGQVFERQPTHQPDPSLWPDAAWQLPAKPGRIVACSVLGQGWIQKFVTWVSLAAQMVKNPPVNAGGMSASLGLGRYPQRRKCQPTPGLLPGEFLGQRSLAGYSPCSHKKLDTTEWLTLSLQI